ncbi:MAG: hypothetical protein IPM16_17110 [Chloroflexi bacterium]|nr:hypothetical protein [Chloroflexota bacterium]
MTHPDWLEWLRGAATPTIRYLACRDLLGLPEADRELRADRDAIEREGPVPALYAKQSPAGPWAVDKNYYQPKYFSTHWTMTLLAELHADPADPRFQHGAVHMLGATEGDIRQRQAQGAHGFSCLFGNILRYVLQAGLADDPRAQAMIDYAVRDLSGGPCVCAWNSEHRCGWGAVRTLYGLAALPAERRSPALIAAVDRTLDFLLDSFHLELADYPVPEGGSVHPLWFKLNFPLFYQTDILFTLRVLSEWDALDHPGASNALDWLEAQRLENGHWRGVSPYRQRTWRVFGGNEETMRWATLHAATVLKHAGRLQTAGTPLLM